jgi:DNA-binding LacI/PurR family transcriptional regulator
MSIATSRDVAERAGVSPKTVSNVVNGVDARVSKETAERVRRAIAELGYQPNLNARRLRTGRSRMLALVVPDLRNPYFSQVAAASIRVARSFGYNLFIEETGDDPEAELSASRGFGDPMIEGVILAPLHLDQARLQAELQTPVVLLGERDPEVSLARVGFDNREAGRAITSHLIERGYRRIGVIGHSGTDLNPTATRRFEGYVQAHRDAGLKVIRTLAPTYPPTAYDREGGKQQAIALLRRRSPPDALFCLADVLAFGAIAAADEMGLRIPDDIGITGFDGLDEAINRKPTLTTVVPDIESMAVAAVRALVDRDEPEPSEAGPNVDCSFEIVYGDSTRPSSS